MFKHMLHEGSIYIIKNFMVTESVGNYRPINSDFKITFYKTTSLKKIDEETVDIPKTGFQFITSEMVDSRINNNTILSDVIGCLCGIGDMECVGSKWKKRDIEIITDYLVKTKITLWEDCGEKFDPYLYKDVGPYIVIVTSAQVKEFRGVISFATTSASKIYVNLQTDYVSSLVDKFAAKSNGIKTIEKANGNSVPPEEEMFLNRMSIGQLLGCNWSSELQEHFVTVRAKIIEIDNTFGWFYVSCNSCQKKARLLNGVYMCPYCDKECKLPLVKFKIHVKVKEEKDETIVKEEKDETTFVLFNNIAEKLLDTSAHKLFNRLTSHIDEVPELLENLCGKDFVFKLKLSSYNLKLGLENFTVTKLFTPNDELELQYKLSKQKKGESSTDDVCEPKKKKAKAFGKNKECSNISFEYLEDSEGEEHVVDDATKKKRRNVIIDDDELNDGDKNK